MSNRDRIDINSYVKVLQTLGRFYILPRLQFIYTERNEPQLLFLGSPSLRSFRASRSLMSGNADHLHAFVDLLPSTAPKTQALHTTFPLWERCLRAIQRMPELRFLCIDAGDFDNRQSLSADFLMNFASRQILRRLWLHGKISIVPPLSSGVPVSIFHTLALLSLTTLNETSIAEYTPLFHVGKFPSLQKIIIRLVDDHTPGRSPSPTKLWRNFFKHLRSATTNSLSAMTVQITGSIASQVSFEDIPDLQTFSFDGFRTNLFHSLSAANVLRMFACWPGFTRLQISGVNQVTIGFSLLVDIARQFPLLEDLEIQINCQTFPGVDDVPILQHDLDTLTLSPLHLKYHITLARCIDRVFPKLVVLSISGSAEFLKSGVGKEVQEIYEGLQSARKDQRKRDQASISSTSH